MLNNLPIYLIISLISTIIIELLFSFILGVRDKKDLINITLVNILTNPLVVLISFIINIFFGLLYRNGVLLILEILVVLLEGFIYQKYLKFKKINPYVLSLILNFLSYFIGLIINLFL